MRIVLHISIALLLLFGGATLPLHAWLFHDHADHEHVCHEHMQATHDAPHNHAGGDDAHPCGFCGRFVSHDVALVQGTRITSAPGGQSTILPGDCNAPKSRERSACAARAPPQHA